MKPWDVFRVDKYPGYKRWLVTEWLLPRLAARNGVTIGAHVSVLGKPIISVAPGSAIEIGSRSVLCSDGRRTALGVSHPVVLRTLRSGATLRIGRGVRMSGCTICAAQSVCIEDGVCIGSNATIVDTDFHALAPETRLGPEDEQAAAAIPVLIGRGAFLGGSCFVLKGVTIGEEAVVGAAAVVTQDVPRRAIVAGNPARIVGSVPADRLAARTVKE